MSKYLAIFCSDIHLSLTPPALRADEPSWLDAMRRPLRELRRLSEGLGKKNHGQKTTGWKPVPIICAGDVFDHWNVAPELITFAMQELPHMYAVPGQHDLRYHEYEDIERTAYWCLVEAGIITNIEPGAPLDIGGGLVLHGFPWGFKPEPLQEKDKRDGEIHIAVIHHYLFTSMDNSYVAAPENCRLANLTPCLKGYDYVVSGDNHKGWIVQ